MAARTNRSLVRLIAALSAQLSELQKASGALCGIGAARLGYLVTDALRALRNPARGAAGSLDELCRYHAVTLAQPKATEPVTGADRGYGARSAAAMIPDLVAELAGPELPEVVDSAIGPLRLIDQLRATNLLCVDLACTTGKDAQPAALAEAVRALASVLVERYPGRSIEVRIPPHAAVQVGTGEQGPTHTRGTPPNVVETSPPVFLALATGRLAWRQAIESGQLTSSGAHAARVARMLPVIGLH